MSYSSNALLDAIANPKQVDVAGAYGTANKLAAGIWANREAQAQQLRGQLIGQATDADGNFDRSMFNRLAAGAGPGYALAAPAGLDQSTRIGGEQQTQALKNFTAQSTALDSLGPNATYQQVHDKVSEGVKAGWLQPAGANSVLVGMPQSDDPQSRATRSHILQTIGDQVRTATERLQSQNGVPTIQDTGGQKIPGAVNPRGGAFTPAGAPITNTTSPEYRAGLTTVPKQVPQLNQDGSPKLGPDGQPLMTWVQYPVPRSDLAPNAAGTAGLPTPPIPPGSGGGNPANPPGTPAPGTVPVTPGDGVQPGRIRPAAGSALLNPSASPPPVPQSPSGGPATALPTSPPQNQPEAATLDLKAFSTARETQPALQTQDQNLQHAYDALKLITTGRTTETLSAMRNALAANGMLPKGAVNDQALYEIFNKYTERTIADAGNKGGTDTARALAAASNPGTPLLTESNLVFLRNDIGKNRQAMLPLLTAPDTATGNGFGNHQSKMSDPTYVDYRGLNWNMYSQKEQTEITKSVGPVGSPREMALQRAKGMGLHFWPETGPVSAVPHASIALPPRNGLAMNMPPAPGQNMLAMGYA